MATLARSIKRMEDGNCTYTASPDRNRFCNVVKMGVYVHAACSFMYAENAIVVGSQFKLWQKLASLVFFLLIGASHGTNEGRRKIL